MRKFPIVVVEWDDTSTHSGWTDEKDDCGDYTVRCHSVGWKVKTTRTHIHLTPMRDNFGKCDDRQIIPRGCIKSIRRLE